MNPQAAGPSDPPPPVPSPAIRVPDTLSVTQPGERTICVIRRHPVGIFGVYAVSGIVLVVIAILAFLAAPAAVNTSGTSGAVMAGMLAFIIAAIVCVAFCLVATKVYWGNTWTLTTDSITQVSRAGLFRRQSSQLSLENLEDVTSEQDGILTRMFNYGVLRVETASESGKFVFPYCPNPNYYAQQVLAARETFERNRRAEEMTYQQARQVPQNPAPMPMPAPEYRPAPLEAMPQQPAPPPPAPQPQPPQVQPPAGPQAYDPGSDTTAS